MVQVGQDPEGFETAVGRDWLFTDTGKIRSRASVRRKILGHLKAIGNFDAEVREEA